jgi:hypothetical protein
VSAATFNGHRVTAARVFLPAWGCWHAEIDVDGEFTITGACTLVIADLTLKGTVISGGPAKGRSFYRIVGGAGGWGKSLKPTSYSDDAGVKIAKIIGEAASAVGETVGTRR